MPVNTAAPARNSPASAIITASRLSGAIELASGGGDITASGLDGSVRLSDGAGNIVVTGLAATDVIADNGSGNITLTFTKVPRQVM
jgi:DUF4097 and DUF4098 domain-containing protein YvlB